MREYLFVFLYGAVTLASLFLTIFWTRFAVKRKRQVPAGKLFRDRYFMLAAGIALDALAWLLITGFRTVANLHYGLSKALHGWEGVGIALGLGAAMLSKVILVWLADIEDEPPVWTWSKWLAVATIVWGIAAAVAIGFMPESDYRPEPEMNDGR